MASEKKQPKSTSGKSKRGHSDCAECSEKRHQKNSDHAQRSRSASVHASRSSRSSTRVKEVRSEEHNSSRDVIVAAAPASPVVKPSKSTRRSSTSLVVPEPQEPPAIYKYPHRRKEAPQTISTVVYSTSESFSSAHGKGRPPAPILPLDQQDRYADAEKARKKKGGAITPEEGALASLAALTCFCCLPWCFPCCCCLV